jgi:hypothetical protein
MKLPRIPVTTKWGEPARIDLVNIQFGSHREHLDRQLRYIVHVTVLNEDGTNKSQYQFWGATEGTVNSVLSEPVNLKEIMRGNY